MTEKKDIDSDKKRVKYAGFWLRVFAYTIDIIPILLLTLVISKVFFGLGTTFTYLFEEKTAESRAMFLSERNKIRDLSIIFWILYSAVMDRSKFQGTIGKYIMKIKVVNKEYKRLSTKESIIRNTSKLISWLPIYLGFLWVGISKSKQGWHDKIAKTFVVKR